MDSLDIQKDWFLENPKGRLMEKYAKNNIPLFYNKIQQYPGERFVEKLYNYYEHNMEVPKCICGKPLKFNTFTLGYHHFCSQKCNTGSMERAQKIKETTIKKYGVENVSQSILIKQKKENTTLKNYGVKHFNNRVKASQTMNKKYGVDNISKLSYIKQQKKETLDSHFHGDLTPIFEKAKKTCLEKYGVDNIFKLDSVRKNATTSYYRIFLKNNPLVESIIRNDEIIYECRCPHPECEKCDERKFKISAAIYNNRKYSGGEFCTHLLPPDDRKIRNTSLEIFIRNILDEYNVKYIANERRVLNGKELDVYIPSKHIAIECNGCRWHSSLFKSKKYHYNKFQECQNKGIQLLTFWEDQIFTSPEKIKAILLSKLGIYQERIYARKCDICEMGAGESGYLINQWHLQGTAGSSVRIGLYYNNEVVAIMTFGKRKLFKKDDWELIRYCVRPGYQIIGGASKLFNYFIKTYHPENIISFSSNDISTGDLYRILGFEKEGETFSYWYVDKKMKRYHRYNFRKSELISKGYDAEKSEFEITNEMGLMRIYDSGMTKWVKHR